MKPDPNGDALPSEEDKKDQINRLKEQVADTTEVVLDTIDQLVERGLKLESLVDTTSETDNKALEFTGNARKMLVKAQFKSWALSAAMVGGVVGGFYGLSMGASIPMLLASSGIVAALFYGAMWMASGLIQSGMRLPFFGLSFQSEMSRDQYREPNTKIAELIPEVVSSAPLLVHAYQNASEYQNTPVINYSNLDETSRVAFTR